MAALVSMQIYLQASAKSALQERAKANGTTVAKEVRSAVDDYLAWTSDGDLKLLDAAAQEAKKHLDAMVGELDRINAIFDRTFDALDKIRSQSPVAAE